MREFLTEPLTTTARRFVVARYRRATLASKLRAKGEIDLHFGCGEVDDARFVNVDARPYPHVDLVTNSPYLQEFEANSARSLYACHVFEHFPFRMQLPILKRWLEILKPGGVLRLSVPDFDKIVDRYRGEGNSTDSIMPILMGGQEYAGNFHHAIFNRKSLETLLVRAGFEAIGPWHPRDEQPRWPDDWSWADDISLNSIGRKPRLRGRDS